MKSKLSFLTPAALLLAAASVNSNAAFVISPTGLANPVSTITFDEVVLPSGTPLTTQYLPFGVAFQNLSYNTDSVSFGGVVAPGAENFYPITNPFSVFFTSPQTDAALNFISNNGEVTTFEAYLGGVLQDSGSAQTGISDTQFYGFSGITFDEIRMQVSLNVNGAAAIDNIEFNNMEAVPEVGTMASAALFAFGAVTTVARRMRNK